MQHSSVKHWYNGEVCDSQDKEVFADENTKMLNSLVSIPSWALCSKSPVEELKLQMAKDWK